MKTIFLVDDDQMILDLYQLKFKKLGYNVNIFSETGSLMNEILEKKPSLVLLDRRIGETDGLEVLKEIRQKEENKNLPIIILSNLDPTQEEFALVKSLAPTEYLIKEKIDLNELAEKIKSLTSTN